MKRNSNLDILRILACIFVVMSHVSSGCATMEVPSVDWAISHMFNSVGHTGTILFFMISGSLLLSEEYHFELKRFLTHNFLRLFIAYYAWVIIYHMIGFIQRGNFGWIYIKQVITNVIQGNVAYHFWYLPMLLGIYLILPMLRAICKEGRKLMTYFVVLFLVVQVGFGTILLFDFPHKYLFESLMTRIPFTLINHHVGYFILGYLLMGLIKERKLPGNPRVSGIALVVAGVVFGLIGDWVLSLENWNSIEFNGLFSVTMCMSAVGFFVWINSGTMQLSEKTQKMLTRISGLTFGVYMLHPLILDAYNALPVAGVLPVIIEIPFITIVMFVICAAITYLCSFIPGVKKWVLFIS